MNDPQSLLNTLNRPRLLVTAAQIASAHYRRETMLRPLLGDPVPTGPAETVMALFVLEQGLEAARRERHAGYGVERHVRVLAALIAEGQALAARPARRQEKASATSVLRVVM
ncbi:DUF6477 family protein [Meridianimarinicoccus sp. RP-17]|uniref:DUF6477 family protein n=1 Tax=Meridianimarinicoccus zhengii TaxID=2056810 RepID=UPI000DAC866B|nr:DUF6477 family protein [Phycocomes zhengii]